MKQKIKLFSFKLVFDCDEKKKKEQRERKFKHTWKKKNKHTHRHENKQTIKQIAFEQKDTKDRMIIMSGRETERQSQLIIVLVKFATTVH